MRGNQKAFTIIELLVVIAIIGILAAIITPVYSRAKVSAYRSSDISNMNAIRNAIQLYKADQGAYPPQLMGFATLYTVGGATVPASQLRSFVYPKRIPSVETFRPALLRVNESTLTAAVWPSQDPRPVGTTPILDLNGDGLVNNADDTVGARQAFGPGTVVTRTVPVALLNPVEIINGTNTAFFYKVSGYDVAEVRAGGNALCVGDGLPACTELRYSPFWTNLGLSTGGANDDPRQLGYNDPPDSTVVTWNSFYREYSNAQVSRLKQDIVLFLGGSARPYDSKDVAERSWRNLP
jgi:prepilin-type N-terminal cleavage/methylation domain-containing protein